MSRFYKTNQMKRKSFLKNSLLGLGAIISIPTVISGCKQEDIDPNACAVSPEETAGPFPNSISC